MKMKQKLWLFFLGVSCLGFQAQEKSMRISLDEAIAFAIENSYNTKASKNRISSAKETVRETSATGLPQLNASFDYQNFFRNFF